MKLNNICTRLVSQECNKEQLCLRLYGADLHSACDSPPPLAGLYWLAWLRRCHCCSVQPKLCVAVRGPDSPMQFFIIMKPLSYPSKHSHSKSPGVLIHLPGPHMSREMRHSSMSAAKKVAKTAGHIPKNQNSDEEGALLQLQTLKIDTSKRQP